MKLTSRKFILTMTITVGLFAELHFGNIPADMFKYLILFVMGGYLGINAFVGKKK